MTAIYEAYLAKKKKPVSLLYSSTAAAPNFSGTYKAAPVSLPAEKPAPKSKARSLYESYLATKKATAAAKPSLLNTGAAAPNFTGTYQSLNPTQSKIPANQSLKPVPQSRIVPQVTQKYVAPPEIIKKVTKPDIKTAFAFSPTNLVSKAFPVLKPLADAAKQKSLQPLKQHYAAQSKKDFPDPKDKEAVLKSRYLSADFTGPMAFAGTLKKATPVVEKKVVDLLKARNALKPGAVSEKAGRVKALMEEMKAGKFTPINLRSAENWIEDGRHRLEAARRLGLKTYPVLDVSNEYGTAVKAHERSTGKVREYVRTIQGSVSEALSGQSRGMIKNPFFQGGVEAGESLSKSIRQGESSFNPSTYVKEQVAKREAARGTEGVVDKTKSFLANIKSKLVDMASPIEDTLAAAVRKSKIKLLPSEQIKNQIDRVLRAPTLAGQFAKDKGIADVIRKVPNLDEFDQYLIAKHAIDVDTRGIKTGRDLAKDQALVKAFAPKYEQYAARVKEYSNALLDKSVDSGLISKELAEALRARYPNYVPFQRVFEEVESHGGSGGIASLGKQTIVQKIVGSGREIESPIESLLSKTNDVFMQGEKNVAAKLLAGYEKLPGNPFKLKEIQGFVDEKTGRKMFTEGDKAKDTISFFDNGEKRIFATTPEIAQAAKSLNVQQMNILGKIFALPTRVARIGITGINIPFIAANIARDQVSAFINSNHALRSSVANPIVFTKALTTAVGHGKLYDDWIRAAGGGTSFDLAREQVEHTVGSIRAGRNVATKIAYTVRHPSELLRAVENIVARSEEFTRLQQFQGTYKGALKKGLSEAEATIEAAAASRENTINFARRGEWGTVLNSTLLYLNASIQGTRTLLRNLKTKPVSTSVKIAITGLMPVATATYWNLSDPERKAAYQDIAEYEKENNLILIPPNPTKDEQGKWNVIKIPLSQEINSLVGMARKPIEQMYGLDPVAFKDIAQALIGSISPIEPTKGSLTSSLVPQAIKPSVEAITNQSLFTGFPQVSERLSKLSPERQVKPYTSGTARQIGNKLGVSPIKVEEFIKGTFGGVGSQALNAVDRVLAKVGLIPKDQIGGQDILDAITARFNKARGGDEDEKVVDELEELLIKQADESDRLKQEALSLDKELLEMPKETANEHLKELKKTNPLLAEKLKDVIEERKLGLTYSEKLMKQLHVENGERARYIHEKLMELPEEDRAAYYAELRKKKIISDEVAKQVKKLKKGQDL